MNLIAYRDCVQQVKTTCNINVCQRDYAKALEAQVQPAHSLLNTRQTYVCMRAGHLSILPASANNRGGSSLFSILTNRTAPAGNAPASHRRIKETGCKSLRLDEKPGLLIKPGGSFCHCPARCKPNPATWGQVGAGSPRTCGFKNSNGSSESCNRFQSKTVNPLTVYCLLTG